MLSKLFGGGPKLKGLGLPPDAPAEDDAYAIAWRNRFMSARIEHLEKKIKKKNIGGVIAFDLPDDVQSGGLDELTALNVKLQKRVEYLESLLKRP